MTFDQLKNTKALAYTIAIHVVLILAFIFIKYKTIAIPPLPNADLIELEAVPVALGTDLNGFGIEPPEMLMGMPAPPSADAGQSANSEGGAPSANQTDVFRDDETHDDVATVNHPDAAAVIHQSGRPENTPSATRTNRSTTSTRTSNNNNSVRNTGTNNNRGTANSTTQRPKYTFDGANGTGGNGADHNEAGARNRGNGTGNGMMGKPGGDPNSMNFTGGVIGRTIVNPPNPYAEFRTGGKVAVKVWVNRAGQITRYEVRSAANSAIRAIAEQKLKAVRFNKITSGPAEQSGIIYMDFKAGTVK